MACVSVCVCVCVCVSERERERVRERVKERECVFVWHLRGVCSDPSFKGSLQDLFMGTSKRWAMFRSHFNKSTHTHTHRHTQSDCWGDF